MSVRKREWTTAKGEAKAAWLVDYKDQAGVRRFKTFTTRKAAADFAATARVEVRAGVHTADAASVTVMTVTLAAQDWIKAGREAGLEESTIAQRRQHVDLHIKPFLGAMKLPQITAPRVRAFESELREAGRSEGMVRRVLVSLGGILSDALDRGNVAQNVVKARKRRAPGERHKRRLEAGTDIPLPAEVKAIVGGLAGHYRDMILCALFTGLRASELRGLDWRHVDLDGCALHVRQRADRWGAIGSPKTLGSGRTVPLPPIVVNALKARRLRTGGKGLVFGTSKGKPDSIHNIVRRGWWPAQIAAGLTAPRLDRHGQPALMGKYTGIHATRHFYASWCINPPEAGGLGLAPKAVQERLGHSSITVTLDIYGHLFPRQDEGERLAAAEAALLN
jgi:integrase